MAAFLNTNFDRKFWINTVFFVLGGALLVFLYFKYRVPPAISQEMQFVTLDGKEVKLSDYRGKTVFLNFWETWCGPCREEMPTIEKARQVLDSTKIVFLIVGEEGADKIDAFKRLHDYRFNYLLSVKSFHDLGINTYPTTYIIDKHGNIAKSLIGGADWSEGTVIAEIKEIMQ